MKNEGMKMKAVVEFEFTGCNDCMFCFGNHSYDEFFEDEYIDFYCAYKKSDYRSVDKYLYDEACPEWCPLLAQQATINKKSEELKND